MLVYFFIGLIISIIGAIPLGATNVLVINTTLKSTVSGAQKILFPAACGEVILVFIALYASMPIKAFIQTHSWFYLTIPLLMLFIGGILFLNKKTSNKKKSMFRISESTLGFSTGLLNPPVLIYWIFVLSFLNEQMISITVDSAFWILALFITGVFIGKALTLYAFSKSSHYLKSRIGGVSIRINQITGLLLVLVALIHLIKLL